MINIEMLYILFILNIIDDFTSMVMTIFVNQQLLQSGQYIPK